MTTTYKHDEYRNPLIEKPTTHTCLRPDSSSTPQFVPHAQTNEHGKTRIIWIELDWGTALPSVQGAQPSTHRPL